MSCFNDCTLITRKSTTVIKVGVAYVCCSYKTTAGLDYECLRPGIISADKFQRLLVFISTTKIKHFSDYKFLIND